MPIYDFYCPQCKVTEEYYLDRKENAHKCNKCSTLLERQVSAPHFRFKDTSSVSNPSSFRTKYRQQPRVPINVIDALGNGKYRVTSTSRDPELINV
jgi:putative FmdB family regulatory protein